ncbi:MAG: molybdopterin-dependent oxidoreductase [Steroidobacteraceae bacterium]
MSSQPITTFDRVVRTVCSPNCLGTCGVNAFVKDDRIVKLEPAAFPDPGYERICLRGIAMATQRIHHPDRLTHPLIRVGERGEKRWRQATWDEAFDYIVGKLTAIASEHGWRSNAWIKGSGNYGFRSSTSTPRAVNCLGGTLFSYFGLTGDFAGMAGYHAILGEFARSNDISEVTGARYFLSAGRNVADAAHSEMHFLFDAMEQGCKFVMVDPRFTRSAAKADEWVAPRPGTDTALVLGMIYVIVTEGLMKEDYVLAHTNGAFLARKDTGALLRERDLKVNGSHEYMVWDRAVGGAVRVSDAREPALRGDWTFVDVDGNSVECQTAFSANWAEWKVFTPEHAASLCEVPADQIRHVAREYATAHPAWIWLGLGPQRYHHGHITARAWVTLATLCGNIGKPYAGVSIYDAPNLALVMTQPPEWLAPGGKRGHSLPGTSMVEIIASQQPYPIKSLWLSSYGFATQSPLFKRFIQEALPQLDLFVVSEQLMTAAAEYADIVLPCVSYYEDDWDLVGGGENWFMQLRRRAIPPVGESKGDYDICKELCERLGQGADWQLDPEESCRMILATHPDLRIRAVDWETLRRDGVARVPVERPVTPFRDMKFKTPSGRIEIYQEQFADIGEAVLVHKEQIESRLSPRAQEFPLNLITYKHPHSTHSQHMMLPYIRELMPEPRLELAPADAGARGISDGEVVRAFNDRGSFTVKVRVSETVRTGTAAIAEGWWPRDFIDGHPSFLGHIPKNAAQDRIAETNYPIWDVLCEVKRVES